MNKKLFTYLIPLLVLIGGATASAQEGPPPLPEPPPLPGNTGTIQSPIPFITLQTLLTNVIGYLLGLVGLIALLAIIIGGIKIILGFSNEDQVKQGKNIIKWAVIGLVIVLGAYAILQTVTGLLGVKPT